MEENDSERGFKSPKFDQENHSFDASQTQLLQDVDKQLPAKKINFNVEQEVNAVTFEKASLDSINTDREKKRMTQQRVGVSLDSGDTIEHNE